MTDAELKAWFVRCGPPRFDPSPVHFDSERWRSRTDPLTVRTPRPADEGTDQTPGPFFAALMGQWADPVLRYLYDQTLDADRAQRATRAVFHGVARGSTPPAPAALFERADDALGSSAASGPVEGGWASALQQLSPVARRLVVLTIYGRLSFADAARQEEGSVPAVTRAWQDLATALGAPETSVGSEDAWRAWLARFQPPSAAHPLAFDWAAWNQDVPARPQRRRLPARQLGWAAAAALILGVGGYVLSLKTAAMPPLPFISTTPAGSMNLIVLQGTAVATHPFGRSTSSPLPAASAAPGLAVYRIKTITARTPSAAYQIGRFQAGVAFDASGTALVLGPLPGPAPRVYNLAGRGQLLTALHEPGGYRVYRFAGRAGAVRIERAQGSQVLAWADSAGPEPFVHLVSGAWSPDAGQPFGPGPDGSRVLVAPPAGGVAAALLADGVLWHGGSGWWLLPATGPAIPLMHVVPSASPSHLMHLAAPYPASANEVLVHFPFANDFSGASGAAPPGLWWNVGQANWGPTQAVTPTGSMPVPGGWTEFGLAVLMSSATPPTYVHLPGGFFVLNALGHRVAVETLQAGGAVKAAGTYNWATHRFTPAHVAAPPIHATPQVVELPGWGPTWVTSTRTTPGTLQGPSTVTLTAFNGEHRGTITLGAGDTLAVMGRWLLETYAAGQAPRAAWPDQAGHLTWHAVHAGAAVHASSDFVYWVAGTHTYVWMPPFAWPVPG